MANGETERRPVAVGVAGLCGVAIGVGAVLPWVSARGLRPASGINHTSLAGLFQWTYSNSSPFLRSFGAAVLLTGILVLLSALLGSRTLVALFSLMALAAVGLWIGLDATHYNPTDMPYSDLRAGAWLTAAGGLTGLIAALALRRRVPGEAAW
jgi:hypothetical protein